MNKLNIIIVNDFAHINGGAAAVALSSAIALSRLGHRVSLLSGVGPVMPDLIKAGVDVVCLDQPEIASDPGRLRAGVRGLWNKAAGRAMSDLLAEFDPKNSVVHVHGWTKCLSSSVIRATVERQFPVVLTIHDYFLACPNGGFYNYQKNKICQLTPLTGPCILSRCDKHSYARKLWRTARQIVQIESGLIPRRLRHFIAISEFSLDVIKSYLPEQARIHRIPNPIDMEMAEPVRCEQNKSMVQIGRLSPEKGILLFAAAAGEAGITPVFLGDGPCRSQLEQQFPEAIITGWLPREQVNNQLRWARALVFPSLWHETQGMVVLEAAAVGVPAIVADTCAARDLVSDGVTGLWFKGGDVNDLVKKIHLIKDNTLAGKLGRAAYDKYWSDPPTMPRHIDRLLSVYDEMLNRQRCPQKATTLSKGDYACV